ncbi:MAG: twin-arginine translocase TatA/TatE family subunit [Polyangiaceae bacterium]
MAVGPWQIVIIALIILLLFGANRLSEIGKGLGEGIRNFKKGISDDGSDELADKDPKKLKGDPKKKAKKATDAEFEDDDEEKG